jgi:hypothetical protein
VLEQRGLVRPCGKASLAAIYEGKMSYLYMEEWKKNKGMGKTGRFKLKRPGKAQACGWAIWYRTRR